MPVRIARWGNSASVRLPAPVLAAAKLRIDDPVRIREEDGRIIIERADDRLALATLLAGVTDANRHDEADWGDAQGAEAW